jgi:hypothetical protein
MGTSPIRAKTLTEEKPIHQDPWGLATKARRVICREILRKEIPGPKQSCRADDDDDDKTNPDLYM